MSDYPTIASLEAVHTFPCQYIIKVIGASRETFVEDARAIAAEVTGQPDGVEVSTRLSSKGNRISVTLNIHVASPQQVQELYAGLKGLESLMYIL